MPGPTYVLDRTPPPPVVAPTLDAHQRAVVDHRSGPLLVLAGPGTGKTTTLVEAVVERVRRGLEPDDVLVLTFSRKAADELRERISGRLGRTTAAPAAWTFHAWCLALITAYSAGPAPRLLSGPERLVRIREMLRGSLTGEGTTSWPEALRPALDTRGMAREVADLIDRARERGVEPDDLRRLAAREGRADWAAAATFFEEYVDVIGAKGEMDYGELVRQVIGLLDDPEVLRDVRSRHRAVFVDEYQDTDPAQEELLRLLAGQGGDLVVLGDPDQSIYGFRGADVRCLLDFPERFRTAAGDAAPIRTLRASRRAGAHLLEVSRRVAERLPTPGLPVADRVAHRSLEAVPAEPGTVRVRLFSTGAEEATAIADVLRRAHLEQGRSWSSMAVLVRSGKRSIPLLRRTLVAAGVPIAVASDEVPVGRDPAVAPLLLALRCADDAACLDDDAARVLLLSPLARMTPADLRRLGRALRAGDRARLLEERGPDALALPAPSARLIRDALADPGDLLLVPERDRRVTEPVARLAALLVEARDVLRTGGSVEEALWVLWDGSRWPHRLMAAAAAGGQVGRAADRDLDAVVALFDELARMEERRPRAGVRTVLDEIEAQEIPAESRREGSLTGDSVRLLTAHRSKGLEWDLVIVAGVQDGTWPDLRRRSSLLEADRIGRDEVAPAPTPLQLLVEERRLFYVAITRAREQLLVTAVRSPEDDGDRPSRFLGELGIGVPDDNERPAALLSPASLVARLRRALTDGDASAAAELARMSEVVRAADPGTWWGLRDWTPGAAPVRPADEPVRLSGSMVQSYERCPLAWFLDREARAAQPSTAAQGFGLVIHVLARLVATGAVPADVDALLARLDEVWGSLAFPAPWLRDRERESARAALRAFLRWHGERSERTYLASELPFTVDYAGTVIRGSFDRVELDDEGRVHVADLKTGKNPPTSKEVATHAQLGVYQVALREGALADLPDAPDPVALGGAELVHLRSTTAAGLPRVQAQASLDGSMTWADELIGRVAAGVISEQFPARRNETCERCAFARACPAQEAGGQVVR